MRDMTLLEQKKLQWAKEKEELSKLNDFFSATTTTTTRQFERTSIRTYYSNVDISSSTNSSGKSSTMPRRATYYQEPYKNSSGKDPRHNSCRDYSSYDTDGQYQSADGLDISHGSQRAPMLPPIGRNNRQKQMPMHQNHFVHQNTDEETSGYLSDRMSPVMSWANQMPNQSQYHRPELAHQQNRAKEFSNYIYPSSGDELAPELDAMKIDERRRIPKHKASQLRDIDDNGHDTDFSIPKTPSSMCSDNRNYSRLSSGPPKEERAKWGDRNNHFYDMASKDSSVKSDGPCWLERGFADSGDESVRSYSFIRGQNAPIDPNVLAERTTKRIKALELQNAIKAQVEERERLRKIELEKTLMEERRIEENLRQQRESNEQRFEEEQRITREKLERDQRKQEMMRLAIEKARQEAESEKAKKRRSAYAQMDGESLSPRKTDGEMHENLKPNRTEASETPIKSNEIPSNDEDDNDDEKILIGTPIRMKKKTLNKTYKMPLSGKKEALVQSEKEAATVTAPENNVDGIALVLQTLPPMMPISSNDIINLNQNINNLNTSNIQLAVLLAHQMQQLSSITQNQKQPEILSSKVSSTQENSSSDEKLVTSSQNEIESDVCKQCTGAFEPKEASSKSEEKVTGLDTHTKDAATVTEDFESNSAKRIDESEAKSKSESSHVMDASTQTDRKQEYCFQCRFHHCHHHHVLLRDLTTEDVKTIAVNHVGTKLKCSDKECVNSSNGSRNSCPDTKEPIKLEDRPKWGVNRPVQQYVKASERDPFYMRNKRKKHQKRKFSEEQHRFEDGDVSKDNSAPGSRSTSPSPSIITNSTVTISSPTLNKRKRSVCTEILPIKTDMNGRVYLNFDAASLHVTEDEHRSSSKQRAQKMRMINRSQTANSVRTMDSHQANDGKTEQTAP